jgi:hypothetical protein
MKFLLENMMRNNLVLSIIARATAHKTNASDDILEATNSIRVNVFIIQFNNWYSFIIARSGISRCNINQRQVLNSVVEFMFEKENNRTNKPVNTNAVFMAVNKEG